MYYLLHKNDAIVFIIFSTSIGFVKYPFIPASVASARSYSNAFAVITRIGIVRQYTLSIAAYTAVQKRKSMRQFS